MTEQTKEKTCWNCNKALIPNENWTPGGVRKDWRYCRNCMKKTSKHLSLGRRQGQKKVMEKMKDRIRKESNPIVKKILEDFIKGL